jgi:hypothetical protein
MIDVDVSEHKVATIDESGNMLYEHPKTKFEYEFGENVDPSGDPVFSTHLYSIKTDTTEMVCTLTHNMYVSDEVSGGKPRSTEKRQLNLP